MKVVLKGKDITVIVLIILIICGIIWSYKNCEKHMKELDDLVTPKSTIEKKDTTKKLSDNDEVLEILPLYLNFF